MSATKELKEKNINCLINKNEFVGIIGNSGAGKSTLIKIITGVYLAGSGSLKVKGAEKSFHNPIEATHAGIAVVHQERNLIPEFSVVRNFNVT